MNILRACSGFFYFCKKSHRFFITPITKNKTSSASPIAINAPLICTITSHMPPPLKFSGDCVMICHISASFSFHVSSAFCRFCTIQLSDSNFIISILFIKCNITLYFISPCVPTFICLTSKQFNAWYITGQFNNSVSHFIWFFAVFFYMRYDNLMYSFGYSLRVSFGRKQAYFCICSCPIAHAPK